jgi:hypothetical protein
MLVSTNTNNRILYAQQHIRRMRGGSQSHLMQASDGGYWIVKFQNNPQHIRVLANEFLASRIGRCLGLPIPEVQVIEVSDWLIQNTPELCVDCAGLKTRCCSGLQLACRYAADPECDLVFDYLPESMHANIDNLNMLAACMVLDKWTCNVDGRQVVFTRPSQHRRFSAWFIDQGYCFNAGEWSFPDSVLRGVYSRNSVYAHVTGWDAFEPALSLAEQADLGDLWQCASQMPREWYQQDRAGLSRLIETLHKRRSVIRDLITQFRQHERNPFPNWKHTPQVAVPDLPADALECRA